MRLRKAVGPTILILAIIASVAAIAFAQSTDSKSATQASRSATIAKPPDGMAPVPALNPLDDIGWMKDGKWIAEAKGTDGNVAMRIETRIRGSENSHLLKFTTTFVEHNRPHLQYEGVYLYNPQSKQIEFYYTSAEGEFTHGHAAFDVPTGTLTQDFDIVHTNGQADTLRSLVVRDGDNAYNWNVMSQKNGTWAELFHLRYVREKSGDN